MVQLPQFLPWFCFGFGFQLLTCQKPVFGHNSLSWRDIMISTTNLPCFSIPLSTIGIHQASPVRGHDPGVLDLWNGHELFWLITPLFEAKLRNLWWKIGHMSISKVKIMVITLNKTDDWVVVQLFAMLVIDVSFVLVAKVS